MMLEGLLRGFGKRILVVHDGQLKQKEARKVVTGMPDFGNNHKGVCKG